MPVAVLLSVLLAVASQSPTRAAHASRSSYLPHRVFDTRLKSFADFEVMAADLARADVVLVGEHHGDPNTHRLQHALLEALRRRGVDVTLSLEMFDRDVQPAIDAYLTGAISEPRFREEARAWPRYGTDHHPLVEMARAEGWPLVAANVPRRIATEIAKQGAEVLDGLSPTDRAFVADEIACPRDAYFERFDRAMAGHTARAQPNPSAIAPGVPHEGADVERYYLSQCVRDETMAEAIALAFTGRRSPRGTVVHLSGAFHTDFGTGLTERTRRRLPGRRITAVSILPVDDLDAVRPAGEDLHRAEYLVYTLR
jgi:uncharacterized iron-regulated protein